MLSTLLFVLNLSFMTSLSGSSLDSARAAEPSLETHQSEAQISLAGKRVKPNRKKRPNKKKPNKKKNKNKNKNKNNGKGNDTSGKKQAEEQKDAYLTCRKSEIAAGQARSDAGKQLNACRTQAELIQDAVEFTAAAKLCQDTYEAALAQIPDVDCDELRDDYRKSVKQRGR